MYTSSSQRDLASAATNTHYPSDASDEASSSSKRYLSSASPLAVISHVQPSPPRRLPDHIYHAIRCAAKVVHHLHTKGSTPIIFSVREKLKEEGDIRKIPSRAELSNQLSVDRNRGAIKSAETGELMANPPDLKSYQKQYKQLTNVAKVELDAPLVYYALMIEQSIHHVRYVEFRTGLPAGVDPAHFIACCARGCEDAQDTLAIDRRAIGYGFILLINRGAENNLQLGIETANTAIALRKAGYPVVGIDLAGNEEDFAVTPFAPAFQLIHDYNADPSTPPERRLGITIHSGETAFSREPDGRALSGYQSVEAAVDAGWHPKTRLRIGHGVRIIEHPAVANAFARFQSDPAIVLNKDFRDQLFAQAPLLKRLIDQQICIEACPCSNLQTSAIANYRQHPALFYHALGMRVTINPDNTVISRTDATKDYVKLFSHQNFSLADDQFKQGLAEFISFMENSYRNGVYSSFIFDEVQQQQLIEEGRAEFANVRRKFLPPLADTLKPLIKTGV